MRRKILLLLPILLPLSWNVDAQEELKNQPRELKLEHVSGFGTNDRIDDITINDGTEVWVASNKGVYSLKGPNVAPNHEIKKSNAVAVKTSKKRIIYSGLRDNSIFANNNKIFKIEADLKIEGAVDIEITDMEIYDSKLWVGSSDGIFVFNTNTQRLLKHYHTHNSELNSQMINFIHADRNDNLWIGTDAGFVKIKEGKWSSKDKKLKYHAVAEMKDGLFLVSDRDLNFVKSNGQWNSLGLNRGLSVGPVNDLTIDADGYLYVASDVLIRYDPYKDKIEEYSDILGIVSKKCLALASDDNNNLWLGTADAGLFRIFVGALELDQLSVIPIMENSVTCPGGRSASIKLEVSGGEGPYNYTWNKVNIQGDNPNGLSAGNYSVTVTDVYDHTVVKEITINEPEALQCKVLETGAISGPGKRDGSCKIEITGGTPPYEVVWDNNEKGMHAKRLTWGFHYLNVTDANGCTDELKFEIDKEKFIPELDIAKIEVGQTLRINKLYFEADSSAITEVSYDVLDEVYDFLETNSNVRIEIGGHTNNKPIHEYCDKLSSARAENVAEYLYERGIPSDRISHKGYGKRNPKYSNKTIDGQRRNQRVEVKILEIK